MPTIQELEKAISVYRQEALAEIEAYCAVAGIALTTFGNLCVKDSRFVQKLRDGSVLLPRIEHAREWIKSNPPKSRETQVPNKSENAA